MHATPAHWWDRHKGKFGDLEECKMMMQLRFEKPTTSLAEIFGGRGDPCKQLATWMEVWDTKPKVEWVHMFFHTLGPIPTAWYLETTLRQETLNWVTMSEIFLLTFGMRDWTKPCRI